MSRFKITDHKEARYKKIIDIDTGNKLGELVWFHKKDKWPDHVVITDNKKGLRTRELLEIVNLMNFPEDYCED